MPVMMEPATAPEFSQPRETMVKTAAPIATSALVRTPESRARHSRSTPIAAPSSKAIPKLVAN